MSRNELTYYVLKGIQDGAKPKPHDFQLNQEQWIELIGFIQGEGYAKNIVISRGGRGNKAMVAWLKGATLTDRGKKYLDENGSIL